MPVSDNIPEDIFRPQPAQQVIAPTSNVQQQQHQQVYDDDLNAVLASHCDNSVQINPPAVFNL